MFKNVHLGIISTTVLQYAAPLTMEKHVNLFVNAPMFTVILLPDVLIMLILSQSINHEVIYFKCDNLFVRFLDIIQTTGYEYMSKYLIGKGCNEMKKICIFIYIHTSYI